MKIIPMRKLELLIIMTDLELTRVKELGGARLMPGEAVRRGSEFSAQQQLLFIGTSSCSAPATTPQDPDVLPPSNPLPPTTTADHLIP
ncbi:hypothetical protein AVEN_203651-1 [Araneus ventricosus]|nr:hypothetical protein AVEN_203651-1 [Araneus ventricosus]